SAAAPRTSTSNTALGGAGGYPCVFEVPEGRAEIPCHPERIPCSAQKIPCSPAQGISLEIIGIHSFFGRNCRRFGAKREIFPANSLLAGIFSPLARDW